MLARCAPLLAAALIGILALMPRVVNVDRFVTTDELFWVGRAGNFARALATGQIGGTLQTGHPGVTTMWTALAGMGPNLALQFSGSRREVSRREVSNHSGFIDALSASRRAFGIATAVGVGLTVWLTWRVVGPGPSVLGGTLLALDPFLLAHSRLVHIDASLSIWMVVAFMGGLAYWTGRLGASALIIAGLSSGLALLSKSPAVFLAAAVPLSAVPFRGLAELRKSRYWQALLVWAILAIATYCILWPAIWFDPAGVFASVTTFVRENANPAHAALAADGLGPLYYPLVFLIRSTPLTLVGLVLLAALRPGGIEGRVALTLALYSVGFGLAITVAAKSFDRYLLPVFPALDLLAGLGFWVGIRRLRRHRQIAFAAALILTVGLSLVWIGAAWPYVLTYANPLVGGPRVASALVATGWGEGLDQVAAYLNGRPNAARALVAMPGEIYTTVLDSQFKGQVAPSEGADAAAYDYVVVYTRNHQLGEQPAFFDQRYLAWEPEGVITMSGVPYAWVYRTSGGAPVGAQFGEAAELIGYGLDTAALRPDRPAELRLRWRPLTPGSGLRLAVELRGPNGETVQSVHPLRLDSPPAPGGIVETTFAIPTEQLAGPGEYALGVRVLDQNGRPLPVVSQPKLGPDGRAEGDRITLRGITAR